MCHGKFRIIGTTPKPCLTSMQFFGLQLDRGNLSNALADDLLGDLGLTTDDYNNVSSIRLGIVLVLTGSGNHHSTSLLPGCRVSGSVPDEEIWIQICSANGKSPSCIWL